jgi:hypothetical protein
MDTPGFWLGLTGLLTGLGGILTGYLLKQQAARHTQRQVETAAQVITLQQIVTDLRKRSSQQDEHIREQQELIGDLYVEAAECQASSGELYGWVGTNAPVLKRLAPETPDPPSRRTPKLPRRDAERRTRQAAQNVKLLREAAKEDDGDN